MSEKKKHHHKPHFYDFMFWYTIMRILTFMTGHLLFTFHPFVPLFATIYFGRLLAFYLLMRGWIGNKDIHFKAGFLIDTILTGIELLPWLLGFLIIWPYAFGALISSWHMPLILVVPIVIWLVLLGAKRRFDLD